MKGERDMKKVFVKLVSNMALNSAIKASESISVKNFYQPKEPNMSKFKKN